MYHDDQYDRLKPRKPKSHGAFMGWGCICVLILVGLTAFLYLAPTSEPPELTQTQIDEAKTKIAALQNEVSAIESAGKKGKKRPFHLDLTVNMMNYILQKDPVALNVLNTNGINKAWVEMDKGRVKAYADRNAEGLNATVSALFTPKAVNGKLVFDIDVSTLRIGRAPVPGSMTAKAIRTANKISQAICQDLTNPALKINTVTIANYTVSVIGDAR